MISNLPFNNVVISVSVKYKSLCEWFISDLFKSSEFIEAIFPWIFVISCSRLVNELEENWSEAAKITALPIIDSVKLIINEFSFNWWTVYYLHYHI